MMIKEWLTSQVLPFFFKPDATIPSGSPPMEELPEKSAQDDLSSPSPHETALAEKAQRVELVRVASQTGMDVREISTSITGACRETDPKFLQLGQDLQEIYAAAMELVGVIQSTATHMSQREGGDNCLSQASFLVENTWQSLNNAEGNIDSSLGHIRDLLVHLGKFTAICELISRIGLWFRVVGINIEVECNIQGLTGDTFAGVSKEVNDLSKKINQMVVAIRNDLDTTGNRLSSLASSSSTSLEQIRQMAKKAEGIVHKSYEETRQLLIETTTLIDTATGKARIIGEKVGEVVVGIQFHDSMSQRIEHIVEAFQDIERLCEESKNTEESMMLGSASVILDFQKKQLMTLREDIRGLEATTQASLRVICDEICEMNTDLAASRLTAKGNKQAGADLFKPLQQGLQHMGGLLATGNGMIDALHHSAEETAIMADHLLEMIGGVKNIREETHIKAINTIIMATQLGDQGRTIEVLAKEIRDLADQTGEMTDQVSGIQEDIVSSVAALRESVTLEDATISVADVEQGVAGIGESYRQMQLRIGAVAKDSESLANRINAIGAQVSFLEHLGAKMELYIQKVDQILETLVPWKNSSEVDEENIQRLLARYTMDQERAVHSIDKNDSPDVELFDDASMGSDSSTSFGDNVELF